MLSDRLTPWLLTSNASLGLNAPFGARCFLTYSTGARQTPRSSCLNAPFGARHFLTASTYNAKMRTSRLNATFGARCFLTHVGTDYYQAVCLALMHLWRSVLSDSMQWWQWRRVTTACHNAPFGARCILRLAANMFYNANIAAS